jgi:polysaccharide biosynthesis/export protein
MNRKPKSTLVCLLWWLIAGALSAAPLKTPPADYLLQPGDVVRVQIFQEPQLDRDVRVSQTGEVFLPLIGSIDVKNRSINAVQQDVTLRYKADYLVNPQVNITVMEYQTRTVNVIGAANAPQAIPYPPEQTLTLLDAISRAGGFNRFADKKRVRLTRNGPDGRPVIITINAEELLIGDNGKEGVNQWPLLANDIVFIPERLL